jgi:hypothetical protein
MRIRPSMPFVFFLVFFFGFGFVKQEQNHPKKKIARKKRRR